MVGATDAPWRQALTTVLNHRKDEHPRSAEPQRQELFRMILGYKSTQALYVAAKLGIADHLTRGPIRADELAKEVGANPKALIRLMRHLTNLGIFTQDESRKFGLTPLGELLRNDNPESMRYNAIFAGEENLQGNRRPVAYCPNGRN